MSIRFRLKNHNRYIMSYWFVWEDEKHQCTKFVKCEFEGDHVTITFNERGCGTCACAVIYTERNGRDEILRK